MNVYCERYQLLAGSTFSFDQYSASALRYRREKMENLQHFPAAADHILIRVPGLELPLHLPDQIEVSKGLHATYNPTMLVSQQRRRYTDRNKLTFPIGDTDRLIDNRFLCSQGPFQGTVAVTNISPENLPASLSNRFLRLEAGNPFCCFIEKGYLPVHIDGENTVRYTVHNGQQFPAEIFFGRQVLHLSGIPADDFE
jgi:hypothetical protein